MSRIAECSCGQFRVIVEGEPRSVAVCHCRSCKRRTGSAFAYNAFFPIANVRLEGAHKVYVTQGQEGRKGHRHFCPECGTTVYSRGEKFPGICTVPVGTFADPGFRAPDVSVFEESQHEWLILPSGVEHFVQGRAAGSVRPTSE